MKKVVTKKYLSISFLLTLFIISLFFAINEVRAESVITVTSPNGGEEWSAGDSYVITWASTGIDKVKVLLLWTETDNSPSSLDIVSLNSNPGTYNWTIPSTISSRTNYRIQINDGSKPYVYYDGIDHDTSDTFFTIKEKPTVIQKTITVKSPNGGENWQVGKQQSITWNSAGDVSEVTIALQKGGQYVKNLLWNLSNNGTAVWTPDLSLSSGNDYKIRISYPYDGTIYDESDNYFSISKTSESKCLPNGTLIKLPNDSKVYTIQDCKKKWIQTAEEFNQSGYNWEEVQEVSSPVIQAYTEYLEATANLLRAIGQQRVYRVVNEKRLWVPTVSAFNAQGLKWDDIQDVSETTVNQYPRLKLARATGDPKVYYLTEGGLKRWIPTEQVFNSYNNKWEDVVEIDAVDINAYPDSNLIRLENGEKVYKLENNTKRWIRTAEAFNRLGFDWNSIAPANQTELNYYSEGGVIE